MMKRTKILCTLGPGCDDENIIKEMLEKGMNAARFNFSHGTHDEHAERLERFTRVRDELGFPAATVLDTKGPEIRTGQIDGEIELKEGQAFTLTCVDESCGSEEGIRKNNDAQVSVSYENLYREIGIGDTILVDDGKINLKVCDIKGKAINCIVENGGILSSHKGVNVPGVHVDMEYLTERDRNDILFGIENGFNYIAASFVRNAQDVQNLRRFLDENGGRETGIISKIENAEGIEKFDEILKLSDGIMVARGDMGVEVDYSILPGVQKMIIMKCNQQGKIVITATQMLESMTENPMPTRAEITDVANAVFDGTSAVMLSGETAMGKHPVRTVETMARIVRQAEKDLMSVSSWKERAAIRENADFAGNIPCAIGHAACTVADDINAKVLAAITASGYTARMMSGFRPYQPIIGVTPDERVYHAMSLIWGVDSVKGEIGYGWDQLYSRAAEKIKSRGYAKAGDPVVVSAGIPLAVSGNTNMLRVSTLL